MYQAWVTAEFVLFLLYHIVIPRRESRGSFRSGLIGGWTEVETERLEKIKVNEDTSESYLSGCRKRRKE